MPWPNYAYRANLTCRAYLCNSTKARHPAERSAILSENNTVRYTPRQNKKWYSQPYQQCFYKLFILSVTLPEYRLVLATTAGGHITTNTLFGGRILFSSLHLKAFCSCSWAGMMQLCCCWKVGTIATLLSKWLWPAAQLYRTTLQSW